MCDFGVRASRARVRIRLYSFSPANAVEPKLLIRFPRQAGGLEDSRKNAPTNLLDTCVRRTSKARSSGALIMGVYPKAPRTTWGFMGEGLGFGG